MMNRIQRLLGILCIGTALSPAVYGETLEATDNLHWYRGNLHTHSHWSDGDDYLDMIADWYREHDYQFLVFTDHNVLSNTERWIDVVESKGGVAAFERLKAKFPDFVDQRTGDSGKLEVRLRTFAEIANQFNKPGEFLLIHGEEISDAYKDYPVHLCAGNLVEVIPPMTGGSVFETMQNNVRAVIKQSEQSGQPMMVHLNHPNYGLAVTAEDLMRVRGENFFEVFNGHPASGDLGDQQHANTERMWDIMLSFRLAELDMPLMYGLAVDDCHNYHQVDGDSSVPGRGWVMVLTDKLSPEALLPALDAGKFYSSSGVALSKVEITDKEYIVEIDRVEGETYETRFIGTRRGFDRTSLPVTDDNGKELHATRRYSNDIGETLKTVAGNRASYQFQGDELYVRAIVTSSAAPEFPTRASEHKRAWCQPVKGPGLVKADVRVGVR